jgi:uncharacterized protein (TIGR00661 family)
MSSRIAFFISPHGFGHAARAASVMGALAGMDSSLWFDIFTTVPQWFFSDNLGEMFDYHPLQTDIGLAQKSPFQEDYDKTIQRLNQLLPYDASRISAISQLLQELKSTMIICDIAPLGILVANKAGIPSTLVENFTWDWLYEEYTAGDGQIIPHIEYLRPIFEMADFHIQTDPVCDPKSVDLRAGPASRKIKSPPHEVRQRLGLAVRDKMVLITTGGVPYDYRFVERLKDHQDIHFVIPCNCQAMKTEDNVILIPHRSEFFHPDLANTADAVIGKTGYSTIAEVYHAGVPFGYIPLPKNPESAVLTAFIQNRMNGLEICETEFHDGRWLSRLQPLLDLSSIKRKDPNGADQIAQFVMNQL